MKRLFNTLYVTVDGAYLARERETLVIRAEGKTLLRLPIHGLEGVICLGRVSVSPAFLDLASDNGVTVTMLSETGRFLGRFQGRIHGNVLLRRRHYRLADDLAASAELAGATTTAKTLNSRSVLLRTARDSAAEPAARLKQGVARLDDVLDRLSRTNDLEAIRGLEGEAANVYFGLFNEMVKSDDPEFRFAGRSRRPPLNRVNALLSFLYVVLAHDCASALEGVGLDPAVGFLHRDRPGRPSLALDLMEEFRAVLVDRLALTLINRKQVKAKGFTVRESGAVLMDDETRKKVIKAYQERKREKIIHPFLNEKIEIGLLPHAQALLLARWMRGDLDAYPPYVNKN